MVYVLLLAFLVFWRFLLPDDSERTRRLYAITAFVLLAFFGAIRAVSVGRDTASFVEVFEKIAGRGFVDTWLFSSWTEPGFRFLCAFLGLFTRNGQWLIALTSVFINFSFSRFIYRYVKNIYLGFFLYITLMLYPFYFSMMRQGLAVSVFLFAYGFLRKRQYVRYELLVLLAASFHTSALLFAVFPLFSLIRLNRRRLLYLLPAWGGVTLVAFAFTLQIVRLIQKIVPRYAEYKAYTFDALYVFFAVFATVTGYGIYRLYFSRKNPPPDDAEMSRERDLLTVIMLCGCVVAAMMTRFGQLQRIFNYFEIFYLLYIPMILPAGEYVPSKRQWGLRPAELGASLCCLSYFVVLLFFRSGIWYDALPYQFFWQT